MVRLEVTVSCTIFKIALVAGFLFVCFVPIFFYRQTYIEEKFPDTIYYTEAIRTMDAQIVTIQSGAVKYLVQGSKCRIPNIDPFDAPVRKFFRSENYTSCSKRRLLTFLRKIGTSTTLHLDPSAAPAYSNNSISCCYSSILREPDQKYPDDHIKVTWCKPFKSSVQLQAEFVIVKCKDVKTKKTIYENTHSAIIINDHVKKKIDIMSNNSINPFSVLFIGIDSISRLHFIRSFPQTYQFLEDHEWLSLEGYNKIGDNTFPNVMAILTGFNNSRAYKICNPKILNKLDECPFIWHQFGDRNYVTGYAEDASEIGTFNFKKKGFTKPPTDYYFRPYMLGTERLKKVRKDNMNYCTGPETAGERIFNIAKDFATTFKDNAYFGFFWMNTFSHNELNSASGMDTKIKGFFQDITDNGVLENSVVIFLSDHGMRFGEFRYSSMGWLEERLPFIYMSIPERLKKLFPENFTALELQKNKLTTPYDLHLTLQDILVLSGYNYTVKPSEACPKCRSLFSPPSSDRSCEDAAIEQHWCTCGGWSSIDPSLAIVQRGIKFVISQIHGITNAKDSDSKCANYSLKRVLSASVSETFSYKSDTYLLLVFETNPKAVFEATVLYEYRSTVSWFELKGDISRLDLYDSHSKCVDDGRLKKYCYCITHR